MPQWNDLEIEKATKKKLVSQFGRTEGAEMFSSYLNARRNVVQEILPEIARRQPRLTDHGIDHVRDVIDKIAKLLNGQLDEFNPLELYLLLKSALFHDVGNYYGREDHENNISEIYDYACAAGGTNLQEKSIISRIVKAHSGLGLSGDRDTLKYLDKEDQLKGESIQLLDLASILRFADELSEGCYRTSSFSIARGNYDESCRIYHEYANCVNVYVDTGNERIVLKYNITVNIDGNKLKRQEATRINQLLKYIYNRIVKLDDERQYTKYYSAYLQRIKRVPVSIAFIINGIHDDQIKINFELKDRIIVPGSNALTINQCCPEFNSDFDPPRVVARIRDRIRTV